MEDLGRRHAARGDLRRPAHAVPSDPGSPGAAASFVIVEAAYLGSEEDGAALLQPLRELGPVLDTFAMIPVEDLRHLHMDPPEPVPGVGDGPSLTT